MIKRFLAILLFVVCFTSNVLAYEDFTIIDLTGEHINKQLKAEMGDKVNNNDITFPYDIVLGSVKFEQYDKRFKDKVKKIFDQKVTETCKKKGECLIPYPVSSEGGAVSGIFIKEADKANLESITAKAKEMGLLVPFGIAGKYCGAAVEYSLNNCKVTAILNYTALQSSGSALSFQVFAPKHAKGCSSATEVKKAAEGLADYLEEGLKR